jgi:voltage-gated potassium channel
LRDLQARYGAQSCIPLAKLISLTVSSVGVQRQKHSANTLEEPTPDLCARLFSESNDGHHNAQTPTGQESDALPVVHAGSVRVGSGFFLIDFVKSLLEAKDKWHYLRTWGWIDLLSSIPVIDPLRWGRMARALRILRVLRGVKSARKMAHFMSQRREQSAFFTSVLLTFLLLTSCSIAILEFEADSGGNITTAQDAMWWAVSTMTTVGYGDTYPVTSEGRLIAVFLMTAGVGTFGVLAGLIASWFLSPVAEEADKDREEIKELLLELKAIKQSGPARD